MKIGFFGVFRLNTRGTPGFEKWIINTANQLVKLGHEIYVFGLTSIPGRYIYEFDNKLPEKFNFNYMEIESVWGRFTPLKMRKPPDQQLDLLYISAGYYSLVKQVLLMKGKKVFGFHIPALEHPNGFRSRALLRKLLPEFDGIHVLSPTQTKLLPIHSKILELPNTSFAVNKENNISKYDTFTLVFYSRWELKKGVDTLIYVSNNLPEDTRLIIMGFGSLDLNKLIKKRENIEIKGLVDEKDLYDTVRHSHVTLFPSFAESSSLALLESLALGTPAVYRDIPQNNYMSGIDGNLNIKAITDDEFLKGVIELKRMYERDKNLYLQKCASLKDSVMSVDEYIRKFNNFLVNLL